LAIACTRKGGTLTLIGNLAPSIEVPLQEIVLGELTLRGTTNASTEWDACLTMLSCGAVNVDALTSAVAPLAEGVEWFGRLRRAEPGLMKVILRP
jgi:L-iditol 2-dehydrogenase